MTRLNPEHSIDDRWVHGMNGWRVRVAPAYASLVEGLPADAPGEVTGFEHPNIIWVAFDGEEDPRKLYWHAVRPA